MNKVYVRSVSVSVTIVYSTAHHQLQVYICAHGYAQGEASFIMMHGITTMFMVFNVTLVMLSLTLF